MKATLLALLGFSTLLAVSYGQEFQELQPQMDMAADEEVVDFSAGGPPNFGQVAKNVEAVLDILSKKVVFGKHARKILSKFIRKSTECITKARGLKVRYINQFFLAIPAGMECVTQTLKAKNKMQQNKAANCFEQKLKEFKMTVGMPNGQVQKLQLVIDCLSKKFLKEGGGEDE
ncbi:uncharacterized protein LOC144157997 [Haemaphysalis longicornis]